MNGEIHPKVSVTVITYNHGKWLAECLESIVTQETNFPFEVIVGDDASTDGITQSILLEYSMRYPDLIIPIFHEKNINGTQNYFAVTRKARGEYICHIDGDDMMLPGKIQKQADYLDANPDCTIVSHNVRTIDGANGRVISDKFFNRDIPPKTDINYLCINGCFFSHCSKMYRSSAIISSHRNCRTVDLFLHFEHASKGRIGHINQTLGIYRKSKGTSSSALGAAAKNGEQAYEDAYDRALELGVSYSTVRRGHLRLNYGWALDLLRIGQTERFKQKIRISNKDMKYATLKHKAVYCLSRYPAIVSAVIKAKQLIK